MTKKSNLYEALMERVFFNHYEDGDTTFEFERDEIISAARELGFAPPKNVGDVVYSFRYRKPLPDKVLATAPVGLEWIIEGRGRSLYCFRLGKINRIVPNENLVVTKIPNGTPEIVSAHTLSDEQALLAIVRYNRLIDVFLGMACYSLQNHLRTTVQAIGQVEIDEIYVGIDRVGRQCVVPVQAKGGSDRLSVVQTTQDIACCAEKFPNLVCRAISTQFMADDLIAIFELALDGEEIKLVDERHYRLVPHGQITASDLEDYNLR